MVTGSQWNQLPEKYGKWNSVYRFHLRWAHRNIFGELFKKHVERHGNDGRKVVDAAHIKVHQDACHFASSPCHSSSLWPTQSEKIGAFGGTIKELGIRIIKVGGGVSTYVDLDSVVLTELDTSSEYITWMDSFGLVADPNFDSDGDGLRDLVEFALGTSPLERNYETVLGEMVGGAFRLTRLKESPTPWKVPQISSNGVRFPV